MIPSINPDVSGKRGSWMVAVGLFALGSTVSAAVLGAALGTVGSIVKPILPSKAAWTLAAASAFGYALHELSIFRLPRPQRRRQVPSGWRVRYHPWTAALLYGTALGPGILHYIEASTYYLVLSWAFLVGDPILSALLMGVFGFSQALPHLLAGWRVDSPEASYRTGDRVLSYRALAHRVNGIGLSTAAVLTLFGTFLR